MGILPFEALVSWLPAPLQWAEGPQSPFPVGVGYVGDALPISYSQSATALSLLRSLKGREPGKKPLLAVVDPIFGPQDERLGGKKAALSQSPPFDKAQARYLQTLGREFSEKISSPCQPATTLRRLKASGPLGERLRSLYGQGAEVWSGPEASKERLGRPGLEAFQRLVLATHGLLDGQVAYLQEPALALSDGYLTLTEVLDLRLSA
ncbi:MAG: hypothetical protein AAB270_02990, partial [Chloroflexota bacterium]